MGQPIAYNAQNKNATIQLSFYVRKNKQILLFVYLRPVRLYLKIGEQLYLSSPTND